VRAARYVNPCVCTERGPIKIMGLFWWLSANGCILVENLIFDFNMTTKVTARIPNDILRDLKKYSQGDNFTDHLLHALRSYLKKYRPEKAAKVAKKAAKKKK
jgi:hypothetical protein